MRRAAISLFAAIIFQVVTNVVSALLDQHGEYGSPFVSGAASFMLFGRGESDPLVYAVNVGLTAACLYPASHRGSRFLVLATTAATVAFVALVAATSGDGSAAVRAGSWIAAMVIALGAALARRRLRL